MYFITSFVINKLITHRFSHYFLCFYLVDVLEDCTQIKQSIYHCFNIQLLSIITINARVDKFKSHYILHKSLDTSNNLTQNKSSIFRMKSNMFIEYS